MKKSYPRFFYSCVQEDVILGLTTKSHLILKHTSCTQKSGCCFVSLFLVRYFLLKALEVFKLIYLILSIHACQRWTERIVTDDDSGCSVAATVRRKKKGFVVWFWRASDCEHAQRRSPVGLARGAQSLPAHPTVVSPAISLRASPGGSKGGDLWCNSNKANAALHHTFFKPLKQVKPAPRPTRSKPPSTGSS